MHSHGIQLGNTRLQRILQDKPFSLTNKYQENKKNKREVLMTDLRETQPGQSVSLWNLNKNESTVEKNL